MTLLIALLLHIVFAAAWFGLGLRVSAQARYLLTLDRSAAASFATDLARTVRFMDVFLVLTAVFALLTFFAGGGFGRYGAAYHTSILLILLMLGVQFFLVGPAFRKLRGVVADAALPHEAGSGAAKRLAMGTGIMHLLWLVMLALMFAHRW